MSSLVAMAAQIVAAQATSTAMSTEEIISSLTRIHSTIGQLAGGVTQAPLRAVAANTDVAIASIAPPRQLPKSVRPKAAPQAQAEPAPAVVQEQPKVSVEDSFGEKEITCLICGDKLRVLRKHLAMKHGMKPAEYRKRFGIPTHQSLCAKETSERAKEVGNRLAKWRKVASESTTVAAVAEVKRKPGRPKGSKTDPMSAKRQGAAAKALKASAATTPPAAQPAAS